MSERELRRSLREAPLADEEDAAERGWQVARAAFLGREPVHRERRVQVRALAALALVGAIVAVAVTPAGGWIRDRIGRERVVGVDHARPALTSLPAPGRMLVAARSGVWVVSRDGSRRFLGRYAGASWSPHGLFVVAWRGRELAALDPAKTGGVRWSLARGRIAAARWAPSGFRIAYRSGGSLRVVAGDGTGDRRVDRHVAPVAPAWWPGETNRLAYADARGRIRLVDVDTGRILWRTPALPPARSLEWSSDGSRLLVLGARMLRTYDATGHLVDARAAPSGAVYSAATFRPGTTSIAAAVVSQTAAESSVRLVRGGAPGRLLFAGPGPFPNLVWSPDGRYLALGWKRAGQWLFLPAERHRRPIATANVARAFDPHAPLGGAFPRIEGWTGAGTS